ncbi:hypothetical protein SASPL_129156 [Salvia splendens]|uniref:4-alpha-glucanotransferase n=1 Tax=Salvia splendens TaxID=180675 RepID=A0A8X8XDU4_SALSN|nr:hypothetical protein SASPL_129156 [Salvia splendens]
MSNLSLFIGGKPSNSVIISFRIPYFTHWGQQILVCGSERVLGSWDVKKGLLLSPAHHGDELIWSGSLSVPAGFTCEYSYYVVDDKKNVIRWEAGKKRKMSLPDSAQHGQLLELHDLWQQLIGDISFGLISYATMTGSDDLVLRSAFKNVIFRSSGSLKIERPLESVQNVSDNEDSVVVQFRICCPNIEADTSVYVIGSPSKLGQWKTDGALKLSYADESVWVAESVIKKDEFPDMPWRGAGVAIPMFSLRSEADLGVGEFLDLKLLVDWSVDSGFHLVQLLPINDTSVHGMWWDSYPYSSLSVFALHPLYLRVQALSENLSEDIKQEIEQTRKDLDKKDVDYDATMAAKISIAKKIYAMEKETILDSDEFQNYFSENQEWLKPYAAFCFLRDFFETSDHSQWGRFSNFSKDKLEKLVSKESLHYDIIGFHYYIQFHLHKQLSEAAEYARKKGVVLKGDLPIGVDRNSVDTWVYPTLFRMNTSTGAPPDYFDKNGQNWGFPTYNWEEMSKDNYGWWRGRLSQEELEKEGIWDFNRLSRPYITQSLLQEKFGALWTVVASNFLNEYQKDHYEFKEDSNTEKKIAAKLKSCLERSIFLDSEDKLRRSLFDLIQASIWNNGNGMLSFSIHAESEAKTDPEDPKMFYPRFNLEDTLSFTSLDQHSPNVLKRLYYDYYFQRQEDLWRQNALKTLPALLNSSDMLACGEDLGLIPSCVHPVMQELGLIGLRIQRMPNEPELEFGIPSQYSYMTVCAPSCHDCSTLRAWWEEDEERRRKFFKAMLGSDMLPPDRCTPEIAHFILRQHVESPSMWAIFPLQDLLALKEEYTTRPAVEETINDPTNPKHYWRFRVHVTVESLKKDKELVSSIKDLIRSSGRSCPSSQDDEVQEAKLSKEAVKQQPANGGGQLKGATPKAAAVIA